MPLFLGETHPDLPHLDESNEELPCRILSDFTILDANTRKPISLYELDSPESSADPIATGIVRPLPEDPASDEETELDDEDASESGDCETFTICTTTIFTYWTGATSTVWLRTEYSWYLLDTPNRIYRDLYAKFWIPHALVNLLVGIVSQDSAPELCAIDAVDKFERLLTIEHAITNHPFECERILDCPLAGTFPEHVCTSSFF